MISFFRSLKLGKKPAITMDNHSQPITIYHSGGWLTLNLADPDKLDEIIKNQKIIMATLADIQKKNEQLIAEVQAEDTVIDSAVTLITGFGTTLADIKQQLADAIAQNDPTAIQAVVDSMDKTITDIDTKKQQLADAVSANTGQ